MHEDQVQQVRAFNRAVTRRIGALGDDYLGRGRPLGEARILFEIGPEGADVRDLRTRLCLDSGYLSRMLRSLEAQDLVRCGRSAGDARVRRATLTRKGAREWSVLDRQSREFAGSLLAPLGEPQRARLLAAMAEVERLMRAAAVTIEVADPAGTEARACLASYFEELAQRFERGFDAGAAPPPQDYAPPAGAFVLARLDGQAIGCGAMRRRELRVGEIKHMWVAPSARGLGVAQRLLQALEAHAAACGIDVLRLDTNRTLGEARALYLRNGYREIERYNDNPYADHWFEKRGLRQVP